jgi:hypothetical protein
MKENKVLDYQVTTELYLIENMDINCQQYNSLENAKFKNYFRTSP